MFLQTFFWNIAQSRFTPLLGSCLHVCKRITLKHGINPYSNFGVKFLVPRTCRSSTGAMPRPNYAIYLLAGSLIAAEKESKEESELVKSVKLAVLSMQRGEHERAERILHVSLRQAQEQQHAPAVTYIYSLLADCALQQRHLQRAEKLLLELSRRLAASADTNDNSFVEVSLKLASLYAARGETDNADTGFRFCIDAQQRKIDAAGDQSVEEDTLALWGMAVDWYARFLSSRGEHARARDLTERALEVCVRLMGETSEQSLVLLSDLGAMEALCEQYDRAVEHLSRAVQLGRQQRHEDLPSFYVNLGMVHVQQGLLKEAEQACRSGARLARKSKDAAAADEAAKCLAKVKNLLNAKV